MNLTLRERLLITLRGGRADRVPWNIYAWLLPQTEVGHALQRQGLSLMGSSRILRAIQQEVTVHEERREVAGQTWFHLRLETPVGTLTEEATWEPSTNSRWIRKYLISNAEDYRAAEFVLRHTRFEPDDAPFLEADAAMGPHGIVIGEIMPIPIMQAMVAWLGAEGLTEGLYLYPDRFASFLDALTQHYRRQVELAAASPAEIIWFPDNVTANIISPRLFEHYCAPNYAHATAILRQAGKIPIAHYDGSIRPLLAHLARTELPVIEAFTPPPMGDVTVAEALAAWPQKVIWVNFPGCLFFEPAELIEAYAAELLRQGAASGRLIIGCTEEFPVDAFEKTFTAIGRAWARQGAITP